MSTKSKDKKIEVLLPLASEAATTAIEKIKEKENQVVAQLLNAVTRNITNAMNKGQFSTYSYLGYYKENSVCFDTHFNNLVRLLAAFGYNVTIDGDNLKIKWGN